MTMAMSAYFRTLRGRHNFTQPYIAEQVGVDKATVWRWENEGRRPDGPTMHALLDVLHGDMDDIKEIDADPSNEEKGAHLAEIRFNTYQSQRVEQIINETAPKDLDHIFAEIRKEAQVKPGVIDALRLFLSGWRSPGGGQSH